MSYIVKKFGGTSVGSAASLQALIKILKNETSESQVVVVASALSGVTDLLLRLGVESSNRSENAKDTYTLIVDRHSHLIHNILDQEFSQKCFDEIITFFDEIKNLSTGLTLLNEMTARSQDKIMSYGEILSTTILKYFLAQNQMENVWIDSRLCMITDSSYTAASIIKDVSYEKIKDQISEVKEKYILLPGFIASAEDGSTTTLGRGGSDYTAALVAAAIHADVLEIWTDVDGIMTADPRTVKEARVIPQLSYQEAFELSHFGAKVLYPPTIQPVADVGIPLFIKNTFSSEAPGTRIEKTNSNTTSIVCGISSIQPISLLSLEGSGMIGIPGFSKRMFETLSLKHINVILITQASSEHSICVGIEEKDADIAVQALTREFEWELHTQKIDPITAEKNLAILALVGDNMKNHTGISGRMFYALGKNGVNIRAIAQGSSERNISTVISIQDVKKAINILHEEFFSSVQKQINLYIAGLGNVGKRLLSILMENKETIKNEMQLDIRIAGLINSKNQIINHQGIELENWQNDLQESERSDINGFTEEIINANLRNSIFIDITSHSEVADTYSKLLKKSINIVACNKVAASSSFQNYSQLKSLAKEYTTQFLFETNVGAALPILTTLNDLIRSGDKVKQLDAVLSGTLNFVFNSYDSSKSFAEVVRQAQEEGYTEPDPRLDLTGKDVIRKLLILVREAGYEMEFEDIACTSFLPEECLHGDVEDFYKSLQKHESHFQNLYKKAAEKNAKLKFVASFQDGHAKVGLQEITPDHDLYNLYGKDNIVMFRTLRYPEQPLVIKGAGAGADVTASGIFADILRAAK